MVAFSSILAIGTLIASALAAPLHSELGRRALPIRISASTARSYLSQLTVATSSDPPTYNRDYFNHWIAASGQCNTRESVLKRDGTNVITDTNCAAVAGYWVSPYHNVPITLASDLDIDHVVPLKEAGISGARDWTTARRKQFANDLTQPQLAAVTTDLNQAKGDKDPATWLPPLDSFKCTYAVAWIQVKYHYGLTIDSAEKTALTNTLDTYC